MTFVLALRRFFIVSLIVMAIVFIFVVMFFFMIMRGIFNANS